MKRNCKYDFGIPMFSKIVFKFSVKLIHDRYKKTINNFLIAK